MKLDNLFFWIGKKVARHPLAVMVISLLAISIILTGLMFLEFEDSNTNYEQSFISQKFGSFFRINQFILKAKDNNDDTDIFQKEYLKLVYELQSRIENHTVQFMNTTFSIKDICYQPIGDESCLITSPMDFWKMNYTKMVEDSDIKITAKCLKKSAERDLPCFDRIGAPVQINAVLGKQGCENNEKCDDCNLCRKTARALAVTFLVKNDYYKNRIAATWEKESFIYEIKEFTKELEKGEVNFRFAKDDLNNTGFRNFISRISFAEMKNIDTKSNHKEQIVNLKSLENTNSLVKFINSKENKEFDFKSKAGNFTIQNLKVDFLAERSIPDELDLQNQQNIGIVVISYLLMFLYISVFMGEISLFKFSRVLVALGGILVVILSFLGSVALVSFLKIKLSLISSEVVPFLVLAIGVDNMFIILGAKDKKNIEDLYDHIGATLKEVGPSITTAAFGEFLAFFVGYLTKIPALQSFCLAAAFAVLIDYFLQITLFLAIVTLDEIRTRECRYDVVPCFKFEKEIRDPNKKKFFNEFLSNQYIDFILKKPVKMCVLVFYVILFVLSIIGCLNFPLGLDQNTTVTQNSDLYNYFHTQADFVDVGPPAYLVFYNIDYNNEKNLQLLENLVDNIAILSSVEAPIFSWFKDFKKFMNKRGEWQVECNPNFNYLEKLPLEIQVKEFLKIKINSKCCKEFAVCGEPYKDDIFFGESGLIEASRFRFSHKPLTKQSVYVDSIIQTKSVVSQYAQNFTTYENKDSIFEVNGEKVSISPAFPYSLFYVYYDQYLFIRGIFFENILIALASIFLAVQIIMNIKSALLVTVFVFSTVFNLLGVLWLLNYLPDYIIELNAISVVNMVLACGLSVEFTVHIIIFFFRCRSRDPIEKIKYAMKNVGASVFVGIVTTKILGVSVLYFAPSKVFQIYFFRMYFFLILMGFFHGFVIAPIILSMYKSKKGYSASKELGPDSSYKLVNEILDK